MISYKNKLYILLFPVAILLRLIFNNLEWIDKRVEDEYKDTGKFEYGIHRRVKKILNYLFMISLTCLGMCFITDKNSKT